MVVSGGSGGSFRRHLQLLLRNATLVLAQLHAHLVNGARVHPALLLVVSLVRYVSRIASDVISVGVCSVEVVEAVVVGIVAVRLAVDRVQLLLHALVEVAVRQVLAAETRVLLPVALPVRRSRCSLLGASLSRGEGLRVEADVIVPRSHHVMWLLGLVARFRHAHSWHARLRAVSLSRCSSVGDHRWRVGRT